MYVVITLYNINSNNALCRHPGCGDAVRGTLFVLDSLLPKHGRLWDVSEGWPPARTQPALPAACASHAGTSAYLPGTVCEPTIRPLRARAKGMAAVAEVTCEYTPRTPSLSFQQQARGRVLAHPELYTHRLARVRLRILGRICFGACRARIRADRPTVRRGSDAPAWFYLEHLELGGTFHDLRFARINEGVGRWEG